MDRGAAFERYVGIDYSGAASPASRLAGLRVYVADRDGEAREVRPAEDAPRHWSRRGVAEWLEARLEEPRRTIVGIDHGFSFPETYFEAHGIERDWDAFLDDFVRHWPTAEAPVRDVREGRSGDAAARAGDARWRRLADVRAGGAKSVFHFDVPGSVASSTHAGLAWIVHLRRRLGARVHFWPFDGWAVPSGRSAVAEVYPTLWRAGYPREERTADQHDAFVVAAWLRETDLSGKLGAFLAPSLSAAERRRARYEGFILGVR